MSNAKKKAATSPRAATSNANAKNPTACRCAGQLHFHGFPPPPLPGEGPLADYLEAIGGWLTAWTLAPPFPFRTGRTRPIGKLRWTDYLRSGRGQGVEAYPARGRMGGAPMPAELRAVGLSIIVAPPN